MAIKEGARVVAFSYTTADTVYVFGSGVYEGKEVPPSNIQMMGLSVTSATPKIRLDGFCKVCNKTAQLEAKPGDKPKCPTCAEAKNLLAGEVIWGCECWWTAEDQMPKEIAGRKVVNISITDKRKEEKAKKKIPVTV